MLLCRVKQVVVIDEDFQTVAGKADLPEVSKDAFELDRAAFMLYTSGTTYVFPRVLRYKLNRTVVADRKVWS